ncbi:hypothetical protein HYPSUDRAFT_55120 [Hypholoma sublateritium FD-334 SS-4]|uniref:Ubiquitin-like domain-containing protein n=1 Tax=Hypholoma sublateritium (strain FD-334 SS-4) TaxID=945553 RepID=A0A0D2NSY2_HYPSF|nr:hypothetical protein HYPSUDRAFT_55120 [Hypholoma sublateritium FD-334 SS-4]
MSGEEQQLTLSKDPELKVENANAKITIKILSSTGDQDFFKVERSTGLSNFLGAHYSREVGKDISRIRFLYDGARIQHDDTPSSLNMEDYDTIEVLVEPYSSLFRGWRMLQPFAYYY